MTALEAALGQGTEAVVKLLEGMCEKERRGLFPTALKWYKALGSDFSNEIGGIARATLWQTVPLAMLGTANLSELKKSRMLGVSDIAQALKVLEPRRVDWLESYSSWLLEQNPGSWNFVRQLVRRRWVARPASDAYTIGMMAAAARDGAFALLAADPELLDEVDRLFEVEGSGEHSLAAFDKYTVPDNSWATALIGLSREGKLGRDRLLSNSLRALTYGFAAFRSGWFSRFFEAMEPTPQERAENVEALYLLLGSPIPTTASFALKTLTAVARTHKLSHEKLWDSLGPVWTLASKGPVQQGLKLLAATPPGEPWLSHLTQAAAHPSPEIQREALKLLKRVAPQPAGPWRERWLELLCALEPSVRGEWAAWLGSKDETPAMAKTAPAEQPASAALVNPCSDLQEVYDLASRLLEELSPPHDIERLLDGLTRFSGKGHRQAPALLKRIRTRMRAEDMRGRVAALLSAWLGHPEPITVHQEQQLQGFLEIRLLELGQHIKSGKPLPEGLASLPENEDGTLSAATLAARLVADPRPMPWDFTQAILRLDTNQSGVPPELSGEPAEVLRYALGGPQGSRETPCWWEAADLLREAGKALPWTFQVKATPYTSGGKSWVHRDLTIPELPQRAGAGLVWQHRNDSADSLRWQALISPRLRESFQLMGIVEIANNLDWWMADWSDRVYLESLLQPAECWTRAGTFLAALGLGCKEAGQRGLAVDAVAQGLCNGSLSPTSLGQAMAEAFSTGMITAKRWATSLDELRRFVPLDDLFETLQTFFARPQPDFDCKPLLGPLLEIAVGLRRPISDAKARASLEALKGGGKAGKQAAQILTLAC